MRIGVDGSQRLIAQQADTRFTERGAGSGGERYIFEGTLPMALPSPAMAIS